mmetsp:Transcript_11142/g.32916  ORF Transcript_11142/g.32916 Transcript_11142/m.32916 type:complete len:235 (-) Transcript_11142:718-1422(-)
MATRSFPLGPSTPMRGSSNAPGTRGVTALPSRPNCGFDSSKMSNPTSCPAFTTNSIDSFQEDSWPAWWPFLGGVAASRPEYLIFTTQSALTLPLYSSRLATVTLHMFATGCTIGGIVMGGCGEPMIGRACTVDIIGGGSYAAMGEAYVAVYAVGAVYDDGAVYTVTGGPWGVMAGMASRLPLVGIGCSCVREGCLTTPGTACGCMAIIIGCASGTCMTVPAYSCGSTTEGSGWA